MFAFYRQALCDPLEIGVRSFSLIQNILNAHETSTARGFQGPAVPSLCAPSLWRHSLRPRFVRGWSLLWSFVDCQQWIERTFCCHLAGKNMHFWIVKKYLKILFFPGHSARRHEIKNQWDKSRLDLKNHRNSVRSH